MRSHSPGAFQFCVKLNNTTELRFKSLRFSGAFDTLLSCFKEAALLFAGLKSRPPVLVIDGAEFLMANKPLVNALLTQSKAGLTRPIHYGLALCGQSARFVSLGAWQH